jgi:hypothetical protein
MGGRKVDILKAIQRMELVAWQEKRIEEMTRGELIDALRQLHKSYMDICRAKMSGNELHIFHEDSDEWNERLRIWFYGDDAIEPNNMDEDPERRGVVSLLY